MNLQQSQDEFKEIEENFREWSDMGYSLSSHLFKLLTIEREKNEYLERRLYGTGKF